MRKKDLELGLIDLLNYPVWEFAYGEGGDEYKMKPTNDTPPYDISKKRFLVRASYKLNNGIELHGHIKPINTKDKKFDPIIPIDLNAVIVTNFGNVYFWFGIYQPGREKLDTFYKWLGFQHSEIFPIHVKGDVEIINGIDEGSIEGFLYCKENEVGEFFHLKPSEIRKMY